jgi:hypothetical protein
MLARTLVTGNHGLFSGSEITNVGTVVADNYNLFGINGNAGVEGFTPGPTDIVPPAGVLLPDILNPTLAFNGGLTQTPFEFFPLVNVFVTLDPALDTAFDPMPGPEAPAGTFTITAMFTNTSTTALHVPFFTVTELSGDNLVLNAEEGAQGVGATVPLEAGDGVLAPGETVAAEFVIGLQERVPFRFFVDLFAEPLP